MTRWTAIAGIAGVFLLGACRAAGPLDSGALDAQAADVRPVSGAPAGAAAPDSRPDCPDPQPGRSDDGSCAPGYAYGAYVVTPGGVPVLPRGDASRVAPAAGDRVQGPPAAEPAAREAVRRGPPQTRDAPKAMAEATPDPARGARAGRAAPSADAEPRAKAALSAPRASGPGVDVETALTLTTLCRPDGATQSSISIFCDVQDDADGDSIATLDYREQGADRWTPYLAPKRLKLDDEWIRPGADGVRGTADDVYAFDGDHDFGYYTTSCRSVADIDHASNTCVYGPLSAMINDLAPGTAYEVRVSFADPDGVVEAGAAASQTLSVATPPVPAIWPSRPKVTTVDSVAGLRRAVDAGLAPGDVVALKPGTYTFDTQWRSEAACRGTAADPIVITSSTFWAWDVTIAGANWWFNDCAHIVIRDLNFEADANALYWGRQYNDGSAGAPHRNVTIVRNRFQTRSAHAHAVEFYTSIGSGGGAGGSRDVYIADNLFEGPGRFPQTATQGDGAAVKLSGVNFQVEYNTIRGFVDGTKVGYSSDQRVRSIVLRGNRIDFGLDDAFEFDDAQYHMAVHDNLWTGVRGGLSWQPAWGDTYAFRNVGYGLGARSSPLKIKYTDTDSGGYIFIANNTFTKDGIAWEGLAGSPVGVHLYNNLFLGEDHGFTNGASSYRSTLDIGGYKNGLDRYGSHWDHNAWGYDGYFNMATFVAQNLDFVGHSANGFRGWQARMADLGWAQNDIVLSRTNGAEPAFDDSMLDDAYRPVFAAYPFAAGDPTGDLIRDGFETYRQPIRAGVLDLSAFEPAADSPLVDAGMALPGYTDGYRGAAPDIGAVERGNLRARDYGERVGLDATAIKQLAAGLGQGYLGAGPIRRGETRRFGGATPAAITGDQVYAYNYKAGAPATFDLSSPAAEDDNANGLLDTDSDRIRQLIYDNLGADDRAAWDAGGLHQGGGYAGTAAQASTLYETWCGWAKHGRKAVYLHCTGHGDGGDSSVYAFDFGTGAWARKTAPAAKPTPDLQVCDPADSGTPWTGVAGSASSPTPAHSYDGLTWLPRDGALLFAGGAGTCGPASGYPGRAWLWNPSGGLSEVRADGPTMLGHALPSGAWASDRGVYLATSGTGGVETYDPATGWRSGSVGSYLSTLRTQPQLIWVPRAAFTRQGEGMAVFADRTGLYAIALDASTPPRPGSWTRCVQNVPQDAVSPAGDDVPFDNTGLAYDAGANQLIFWNGEAAVYTLPVDAIDGCAGAPPASWYNSQPADRLFAKHALTGRYVPSQDAFVTNDAGKQNVTYSKFDWFGAVQLADGTAIDGLLVGGNAQAEGIWLLRR